MKKLRLRRPSPAMVVAIAALVLAMGGVGYAATSLPKNSVGTGQIKKNAVTTAKVKNHTLTGKDIDLQKLGIVPSAKVAETATALAALEVHAVGAAGQPAFLSGSANVGKSGELTLPPVTFAKDHDGYVHLDGAAQTGNGVPIPGAIFQLPPGFRPPTGVTQFMSSFTGEKDDIVLIFGSGVVVEGKNVEGYVLGPPGKAVVLSGITFPAGS
jgi:hypothetical protein